MWYELFHLLYKFLNPIHKLKMKHILKPSSCCHSLIPNNESNLLKKETIQVTWRELKRRNKPWCSFNVAIGWKFVHTLIVLSKELVTNDPGFGETFPSSWNQRKEVTCPKQNKKREIPVSSEIKLLVSLQFLNVLEKNEVILHFEGSKFELNQLHQERIKNEINFNKWINKWINKRFQVKHSKWKLFWI